MNGRTERRGIPCNFWALAITGKRTVLEMRSNVCEDPPLFMHGCPTVVRMVVIDWDSTLETVVEGRRKSDEPPEKQMFDRIMISGASLTSTLKPVPFVCVVPEGRWKRRDTKYMFNVMWCLLVRLVVVITEGRQHDSFRAGGRDLSTWWAYHISMAL